MRIFLRCLLLALAWLHFVAQAGELADKLKDGGHVLLMRHAYAPGVGDPPGYTLERCETQRVLNEDGRSQSQRIGRWLRTQGLERARVYASPWCRCTQTAELRAPTPSDHPRSSNKNIAYSSVSQHTNYVPHVHKDVCHTATH